MLWSALRNCVPIQCWLCERCTYSARDVVGICAACVARHVRSPRFPIPAHLQECFATLHFDQPWRELIVRYKFTPEPALARTFASVMRSSAVVSQMCAAADLVVALPLCTQRLAERGFNQSHWLARHLLQQLGLTHKLSSGTLARVRHTRPQRGLDAAQRQRNVDGAFVPLLSSVHLRARKVLLLDDVITTGATLSAAAKPLVEAGALVSAVALAWTPLVQEGLSPET